MPVNEKDEAKSLWFPEAGACEVRSETIGGPAANELLVEMLYSGISRGTESLVFNGLIPASENERMRCPFMGGSFDFPVKYGYSAVGTVLRGAPELIGRAVFCLHPHQDRFLVGRSAVTCLPSGLPPERAVLGANMETALNIGWDAGILPGDRVAVFGAGVVGALVAYIASRIVGTEVALIDRNAQREQLAGALGIPFVHAERIGGEFDVLINASGNADALGQALDHAGQEARIVEASWHGSRQASLPLGGAFHSKRLSIVSSQVGSVPPGQRARWSYGRRMSKALELLRDDRLDALISGETPFDRIAEAYGTVIGDPDTLCHRIQY
ncbi:zinc-binding alcohol dehydrogenase [Pseudohoeflea suaedae]|uniref:Zinc-binding alcohol dehydrogenase n=2 Tax=Pseudohoeflea suaedae TaxID=877384 RepID=A0A4R5PJ70_9HYPH|nr:zinc-binding alcohol dehydrogenase [Pseudohoeflea suaedae]